MTSNCIACAHDLCWPTRQFSVCKWARKYSNFPSPQASQHYHEGKNWSGLLHGSGSGQGLPFLAGGWIAAGLVLVRASKGKIKGWTMWQVEKRNRTATTLHLNQEDCSPFWLHGYHMVLSKQICSEKAPSSWDYQPNLSICTWVSNRRVIQETPSDPVRHLLAL